MNDARPAADHPTSPLALDAGALAQAIAERRWRCVEVTAAALQRIAQIDGELHAFCTLDADAALAQAAALDARLAAQQPVGPLAGVPVAVKDLICTRGLRTSFGSPLYADFMPDEDDVVVERLHAAGAVDRRQDQHLRIRLWRRRPQPAVCDHAQPVEHGADARRLERRLGGGGGGAHGAAGARAATAAARCASPPRCAACSASSPRGGACRSIPAAATSAIPASRAGSRSSISARSPAPSPTPRWRCRCWRDRRRATAIRCRPNPPTGASRRPRRCGGCRIAFSPDLGFAVVDPEVRSAVDDSRAAAWRRDLGTAVALRRTRRSATRSRCSRRWSRSTPTAPACRRWPQRQGVALTGWLRAPGRARLERRRVHRRDPGAQAHRQPHVALHGEDFDFLLTPTTAAPAFAIDLRRADADRRPAVPPTAWTPFSALANLTGQPAATVPAGFTPRRPPGRTADHGPPPRRPRRAGAGARWSRRLLPARAGRGPAL